MSLLCPTVRYRFSGDVVSSEGLQGLTTLGALFLMGVFTYIGRLWHAHVRVATYAVRMACTVCGDELSHNYRRCYRCEGAVHDECRQNFVCLDCRDGDD